MRDPHGYRYLLPIIFNPIAWIAAIGYALGRLATGTRRAARY